MPRPIVASISISALQHNLAVARAHAPDAKVWGVVKANAYGHGLERAMRGLAQADGLALVEVDYALRLRELGWQKPILLLEGFFDADDLPLLARHDIQFAVHCNEQIAMLEAFATEAGLHVHLKMNSGMNRLGFKPDAYRAAYERLKKIASVRSVTMMTHFANADDAGNPDLSLQEQVRRFNAGTQGLAGPKSLCNSAADLLHGELACDWVRPGIMLYGGTPGGGSAADFGLRPAMTLESRIIGVQDIAPGEAVGYGSRFVADQPMKVGVVACGYADGYPRHAPNGTPVVVDGVKTGTVGRVSMDMMAVDLTDVPGAGIGSRVLLWGEGLPIDEVAFAAGTIGYELMCALAPRVAVREVE
ncbi:MULTISPECIES: alanine racemase [unclassified Herbaspirillum]|uniref:alanine racemase n=1 Tax=unclassified Herbaspirillum TaxID=2624150 RepID=UPI00114F3DDA|nr:MULTISPECIES: alanine racemase [unclassified Herbaspirillum]MBB5393063.1 alanine racemase [Herbaspirillum sp. SJZ102]TQK04294.1 alanine racemase [Herbaspirillum sp. SJZ130]TQK09921.1 alanine racemase [Herbaspirillum sp. SJZ106]